MEKRHPAVMTAILGGASIGLDASSLQAKNRLSMTSLPTRAVSRLAADSATDM
jgi:hypothetical protein